MEIPMFCFLLIFYLNSIGMGGMFSTRIFYSRMLENVLEFFLFTINTEAVVFTNQFIFISSYVHILLEK